MANANDPTGRILYVLQGAKRGDGSEDSPYGRIKNAIKAAKPGDTVVVADGIYHENLVFRRSGTEDAPIRLVSANGADAVEIYPDKTSQDTIRISGADNIIIEGFTLHAPEKADRYAVHIEDKNSDTDLADNIVIANNIIHPGEDGEGIKQGKSADVTIRDNMMTGEDSPEPGSGEDEPEPEDDQPEETDEDAGEDQGGTDEPGDTPTTPPENEPAGRIIYVAEGAKRGDGSVDSPFGRINDAIKEAEPGDTILVGEGTYHENVVFRQGGTEDNPVRLISANGPGSVEIHPDNDSKDTIRVSGADNIIIEGFTLYGSDNPSRQVVQIHAQSSNTDPASNIVIANNVIHRGEGDGIKASKSVDITITDNLITGGGNGEAAIDFVGVSGAYIAQNEMRDIPNIALMIKGGSSDIEITGNAFSDIGKNAVEIGGYSPLKFYPPDFVESGNAYEARNVTFSGNMIDGADNTAIRVIGAQNVAVLNNSVTNADKVVTIDDSSKFHETWYADDIYFAGNTFEGGDWLLDRSAGADISYGPAGVSGAEAGDTFVFQDGPASAEMALMADIPLAAPAAASDGDGAGLTPWLLGSDDGSDSGASSISDDFF
ncbi:right-handed parallel beta-helix repeat-containing protein [Rhodophyticola sp. CCM32]|uniref:right-handed parallel beta-helix repeat-containing protein n=1 Tax=Rhodophyticola sp. CCM32 TaxID=2916397 RepID=UPI00143DF96C|nr:right-handed parallel beta-helix repeat-containing protein [Rhodophyticola sp. CCM32]